MLVRGPSLEQVDVALPDRADRGAAATSRSARAPRRVAAEGEDGHLRPLRIDGPGRRGDARRQTHASCSSGPRRAPTGSTAWWRATSAASSWPAATRRATAGRCSASPTSWRRRVPGVFVAGDVRARSIKRVASAVGEGSMAVSLIHEYLAERVSDGPVTARGAADDRPVRRSRRRASSREWVAVARARHVEPGEVIAEQGDQPDGLQLLLEGDAQALDRSTSGRSEPVGRQRAPTWMGAIAVLTGGPLGVRMQAETDVPRSRSSPAEDFRRLAFAQPSIHRRVMQQVAPVIEPRHRRSSRTASGSRRSARWPQDSRTSSTTRRPRHVEPPPQLTEALDVIDSTLARFVESGIEREDAEQLVQLQRRRSPAPRAATALDALDAADAEDELLARLQQLGGRRALATRRAAGRGGRRPAVARARRRSGGPGDRRRAALGRRVADRGPPGRRAARSRRSACRRWWAP